MRRSKLFKFIPIRETRKNTTAISSSNTNKIIQKRPHLPPAPIEVPGHTDVRVLFSYSYSEDQEDKDRDNKDSSIIFYIKYLKT